MATAEECRQALGSLIARISEMNPEDRAAHLADRTLSCRVSDLGITFLTRLGPHGADSVREATAADEAAQIRFTAKSACVASAHDSETTGARHRGRQATTGDKCHWGANDWMLNSESFSQPGSHSYLLR